MQYVQTGAADIGLLAYSISLGEQLKKDGTYLLLPAQCYNEIKQGFAILKNAAKDKETLDTAKRFYNFIMSKPARDIFIKFGFVLPGE